MRSSSAALLLVAIGCFILCVNASNTVQRYGNDGYNRHGYDRYGYNRHGYNKYGYNRLGYNRHGYNRYGYDRYGYNKQGYSRYGYNRLGYDKYGYNSYGYDKYGYNKQGYNYQGYNRHGVYKRPVYTGCYKVQRYGSYQYWNKYRCSCVCHSVVVVVKVVKHARYGRDADAGLLPNDTEKYVPDGLRVPNDTNYQQGKIIYEYLHTPEHKTSFSPKTANHNTTFEHFLDIIRDLPVLHDIEHFLQYILPSYYVQNIIHKITEGKRAVRYKYITYKKKVIRSSICPNGKRPSYYDCTCY